MSEDRPLRHRAQVGGGFRRQAAGGNLALERLSGQDQVVDAALQVRARGGLMLKVGVEEVDVRPFGPDGIEADADGGEPGIGLAGDPGGAFADVSVQVRGRVETAGFRAFTTRSVPR